MFSYIMLPPKCFPRWNGTHINSNWYAYSCSFSPFFSSLFKSWNARYYSLEDGRRLCYECMESAIMDTGDCQPLYHAIRDYYEGMNMRLDQQIPMLLVERQALNEAIVGEKHVINDLLLYVGMYLSFFPEIPL